MESLMNGNVTHRKLVGFGVSLDMNECGEHDKHAAIGRAYVQLKEAEARRWEAKVELESAEALVRAIKTELSELMN